MKALFAQQKATVFTTQKVFLDALLQFFEKVVGNVDESCQRVAVFLDFAKSSDSMPASFFTGNLKNTISVNRPLSF